MEDADGRRWRTQTIQTRGPGSKMGEEALKQKGTILRTPPEADFQTLIRKILYGFYLLTLPISKVENP